MKLIKPYFEILPQSEGLDGIYKPIELAGRTCYKSEDKITEDSAKGFVDRMIKSGHGAMLEHGTVYLKFPIEVDSHSSIVSECKYKNNKYSKVKEHLWDYYVTTNMRVLVENDWLEDLEYLCEPTEYHEKRHTVKFICDRGILAEFTRHRSMSFAAESTRYCNYSRDKFGNEITYIQPCWEMQKDEEELFLLQLEQAQNAYNALISSGWKPQEARAILPNSLKTELVMTGFASDWEHFFYLRTPVNAHPQARELTIPLKEQFIALDYISKDS
jgi:thymidylate synthase (FAD)